MQRTRTTNRKLLKTTASVVLASFRSSTYPRGYASGPHSLRPCWPAVLNSFQGRLRLRLSLVAACNELVLSILCGSAAVSETIQNCIKRDTNDAPERQSLLRSAGASRATCLECFEGGVRGLDRVIDVAVRMGRREEGCFELRGGQIHSLFQHLMEELSIPLRIRQFCCIPIQHRA